MNYYSTSMFEVVDTNFPDLFIAGISIFTIPYWVDPLPEGCVHGYNNIAPDEPGYPTDFLERLDYIRSLGGYAFSFDLYMRVGEEYYFYVAAEFWDYDLFPEDYDKSGRLTEEANVKLQAKVQSKK